MNCFTCQKQLSAYLDGALGARRLQAIRTHLIGCDACSLQSAELSNIKTLLGHAPTQPARTDFWHRAISHLELHALSSLDKPVARTEPRAQSLVQMGSAVGALLVFGLMLSGQRLHPASGPAPAPVSNEAVSISSIVALHTLHESTLPLSDSGRLHSVSAQASDDDIREDGVQDVR